MIAFRTHSTYQLTFRTEVDAQQFMANDDFILKGRMCRMDRCVEVQHSIKIHWLPYYIPASVIVKELEKIKGIKVLHGFQEHSAKDRHKPFSINVRIFSIQSKNIDSIPQFL